MAAPPAPMPSDPARGAIYRARARARFVAAAKPGSDSVKEEDPLFRETGAAEAALAAKVGSMRLDSLIE